MPSIDEVCRCILGENQWKQHHESGSVEPEEFFDKWIPLLYGICPGEYMYRKACIEEVVRWLGDSVVQRSSIEANWRFYGKNKKFPSYLPSILNLLDKQYSILKTLNRLPRYQLDVER